MGMTPQEAEVLHTHYYREYGLAIRGLIKHHQIGASPFRPILSSFIILTARTFFGLYLDALDFDAKCDASLPLEDMLKPDLSTRKLLEDFDPAVSRLWGLTNAYTDVRAPLHVAEVPATDVLLHSTPARGAGVENFESKGFDGRRYLLRLRK